MLYLAPLPIDLNNLDGVQKKILAQAEAYCLSGILVTIVTYLDGYINLIDVETKTITIKEKTANKLGVINYVRTCINDYNIFYIRYPLSDYYFIKLLKSIRYQNKKIIIEVPTFPYDEEGKESIKSRIIHLIDKLYRRKLKRYVDRIVTFTGEDVIFGIKTITTINGFDFDKVVPDYTQCDLSKSIGLIAVSGMFKVHGYDRLINGIVEYKRKGGKRNIVLHLVGDGYCVEHYKQLVEEGGISQSVVFHGKVVGNDLYKLYKGIAIGVNSIAIHRQNLTKESTLKTKEYAAMGLPIISSSYVDAFTPEDNERFVLHVSADETPIDIEKLIYFADNIYSTYDTKELRGIIRQKSYELCDIKRTIIPVLEYVNK